MVGLGRFELPTSRLSGVRSNQLSYRPSDRRAAHWFLAAHERLRTRMSRNRSAAERRITAPQAALGRGRDTPAAARRRRCKVIRNFSVVKHRNARILRKEVIQPQVPLRLPCYDFTPVADLTVVGCLLTVSAPPSGKTNSHGVTGGVYKARERIHRGMLIRDY